MVCDRRPHQSLAQDSVSKHKIGIFMNTSVVKSGLSEGCSRDQPDAAAAAALASGENQPS